ncbi:MAG: hypothetical protein QM770_01010 [Tepidisphaeraceae bacterium]
MTTEFSVRSLAVCVFGVIGLASSAAWAAPARDIQKPPLVGPQDTGPTYDPAASKGQWFQAVSTGGVEYRPYEFYDNIPGEGGGAATTGAIKGIFTPQFGAGSTLTGFLIDASITNDLPGVGVGQPGTNSHGEGLADSNLPAMDMLRVKLTTEFAFGGAVGNPITPPGYPNGPAYTQPTGTPIFAQGYDELAWFSNTTTGGFVVPTYDFGDIALGATKSRQLAFFFATPIVPTAAEYSYYMSLQGADVFTNRTADLKIGNWVDNLGLDTGAAYPGTSLLSGDVSVFFVPEPGVLVVLAGTVGLILRRRA